MRTCPECRRPRAALTLIVITHDDPDGRQRMITARGESATFSTGPPEPLFSGPTPFAFRSAFAEVTLRVAEDYCTCDEIKVSATIPAHHVWRESAYQGA